MDPSDDFPPPPAFFPPPAPAAAAPPPASTAASLIGPRIFVLSLLPGNKYEVDRYFYSPRADVTTGDYAALLAFATHYAYPLAILQCPDLAAFQALIQLPMFACSTKCRLPSSNGDTRF